MTLEFQETLRQNVKVFVSHLPVGELCFVLWGERCLPLDVKATLKSEAELQAYSEL